MRFKSYTRAISTAILRHQTTCRDTRTAALTSHSSGSWEAQPALAVLTCQAVDCTTTFDRIRLDFYDFWGDTPLEKTLYGALFGTHTVDYLTSKTISLTTRHTASVPPEECGPTQ